jgi:TPR repeat protein
MNELHEKIFKNINLTISEASDGNPDAQFDLGMCYETGIGMPEKMLNGQEKDLEEALFWYIFYL